DDALVHEPFEPSAVERVDRYPPNREVAMAEHPFDARYHHIRSLLELKVAIPGELQVDPPDVVRLLVQQGGRARMKWRLQPEPPLRRKIGGHFHVDDQKAVRKGLTDEFKAETATHSRAYAVCGDHPVGVQIVRSIGGFDGQPHAVIAWRHRRELVAPAQLETR